MSVIIPGARGCSFCRGTDHYPCMLRYWCHSTSERDEGSRQGFHLAAMCASSVPEIARRGFTYQARSYLKGPQRREAVDKLRGRIRSLAVCQSAVKGLNLSSGTGSAKTVSDDLENICRRCSRSGTKLGHYTCNLAIDEHNTVSSAGSCEGTGHQNSRNAMSRYTTAHAGHASSKCSCMDASCPTSLAVRHLRW
jgi:hypothetical protein